MTISKGADWGRPVPRPDTLRLAGDDAELAAMLTDGSGTPVAVSAGDMFRTLGARALDGRDELYAFPVDLVDVEIDGAASHVIVSHIVATSPRRRGGPWRGTVLAVMNAEFLGDFDVAPRGHPNDGRVETLRVDTMPVRQRWEVRRRLRNGSHLPHPQITTRSVRSARFDFDRPLRVFGDGVELGTARSVEVAVRADAGTIHA